MDYNAQVPRRRTWLGTGLCYGQTENESAGQQVITTVLFYLISVRRSLSSSLRVTVTFSLTQGTLGKRKGRMAVARVLLNKDAWLHVPRTLRVAGLSNRPRLNYSIMIVLQLVHPLRARCFARCCTTPVLADELEYREKPFVFFSPSHLFPWVGS